MARIEKLTPTIGAEIFDVDLRAPSAELIALVHNAFLDNLVVFFRDHKLTIEELKAFGREFGKLHVHPISVPKIPEHPEITLIEAGPSSKIVAGEDWHSDASADHEPPLGSILNIHEVPENGGGDTLFANMYAAYEALSPQIKVLLEGLTAIHDGEKRRAGRNVINPSERLIWSEHPVVRTHPETGRKSLYVNRAYTSHIVQLSKAESDALLAFLYQHQESAMFQCRFKWRPNSVAFWDNRCTLHQAIWDYFPQRRYGIRVAICGDKPA